MKKIAIALALVLLLTTPSYAINVIDSILCKKVVLQANHMTALVNRFTGEVTYLRLNDGRWIRLTPGVFKNQYQSMYNAQTGRKK